MINAKAFSTGRYPNLGPQLLAEYGVFLLDQVGIEIFSRVREGQWIRIDGHRIQDQAGGLIAEGTVLTESMIRRQMAEAQSNLIPLAEEFIDNTLEFAQREKGFVLGGVEFPRFNTDFENRHVVVVVRGHNYRADLLTLRSYIADVGPILIGVDGGADALLRSVKSRISSLGIWTVSLIRLCGVGQRSWFMLIPMAEHRAFPVSRGLVLKLRQWLLRGLVKILHCF